MNLASRLWYVRWFFWCCRVIDRFCKTKQKLDYSDSRAIKYAAGTNLCHFFRTLLWGNLIFIATLLTYIDVFYVACVLPLQLYGLVSTGKILAWGVGAIGGIALLIFLLPRAEILARSLIRWHADYVRTHPAKPFDPNRPGFWFVVWTYCDAMKQRICPIIKFEDSGK